ncbi:alpha/beta fold hydrolase [Mycolicibacterium thermoresistibile]
MSLAHGGFKSDPLVGHSYGGWLATHTATRQPHRVATLTLVDPAHTVVRLSSRCWRSLALLMACPRSKRAERAAAWIMGNPARGSGIDLLTEVFVAGFDSFAAPWTRRGCSSADQLLHSVELPVLVLLAGNSVDNSQKAIRRVQSVVPAWRVRLWPHASHARPAEAHAEVNACIRRLVAEHSSPQG